jgi:SAM-dependent methyltransferase
MTCPACGSQGARPAFGRHTTFVRCHDCASVYETQPPSAEDLKVIYEGKDYFVKDDGEQPDDGEPVWGYSEDYIAERGFIEAKFERVLGHLERLVAPGRLLDVGCGPGFLLTVAKGRGWDATGIDLNAWATEYARTELGADARTGQVDDDAFAGEVFDAVTMMDMVEHVPDPDALLANVARLVRPGGGIALLTPDAGAPLSRLLGHRWPEVRKPGEHTVLFSVEGLCTMLARHGFEATGFHSIGKTAPLATLVADVSSAVPALSARLRDTVGRSRAAERVVEFDPHTKFCLYGRKVADVPVPALGSSPVTARPDRLSKVDGARRPRLASLTALRRRHGR